MLGELEIWGCEEGAGQRVLWSVAKGGGGEIGGESENRWRWGKIRQRYSGGDLRVGSGGEEEHF